MPQHVWRPDDNLEELGLSSYHVGSRGLTQGVKPGGKGPSPMSQIWS